MTAPPGPGRMPGFVGVAFRARPDASHYDLRWTAVRKRYSAGQQACQRWLHCGGPDFISLRGGMQEIVHEVFGNRSIGGEKPLADIQICDDSAPALEAGNPLIHRVDRGAVGVRLLATWKDAEQQDATRR